MSDQQPHDHEHHHHNHDHADHGCGSCTGPECGQEEDQEFSVLDHLMQMEFMTYIRENYPKSELETDSDEVRQDKLAKLLEAFEEIKREQAKQTQILQEKVVIIQERFPKECKEEFKAMFDVETWKNALVTPTKAGFDQANASMIDPSQGLALPPISEISQHVYQVKMYEDDFLTKINSFVKYAESWLNENGFDLIPPNSMNRYGLSLEYLGLGELFVKLTQYFFQSIVPHHYPFILALMGPDEEEEEHHHHEHKHEHTGEGCCGGDKTCDEQEKKEECKEKGNCCEGETKKCDKPEAAEEEVSTKIPQEKFPVIFDNVHTFTVQYRLTEDKDVAVKTPLSHKNIKELHLHTDASHLTLNLCLGSEFTQGNLFLKGHRCMQHQQIEVNAEASGLGEEELRETAEQVSLPQVPGSAYIHSGTLRHGAEPIESGFRQNLIIWATSNELHKNFKGQYFGPCFVCAMGAASEHGHDHDHNEDGSCCAVTSTDTCEVVATETTQGCQVMVTAETTQVDITESKE